MSEAAIQHYPIVKTSEKTNAFWGCRDCHDGGKGDNAAVDAAKHRRQTNHATYWEFHSRGSFPSVDVSKALKIVPAAAMKKGPPVKLPRNFSSKVDRIKAEEKIRSASAPDGLTNEDLMQLLGITWQQSNGLRIFWQAEGTFRVEKRARQWRVFPS